MNVDCTVVSRRSVREAVERMQRMVEERERLTGIWNGQNDDGDASAIEKDEAAFCAHEVTGEKNDTIDDDTCNHGNDMTLPTLPKVHERLCNNAAALKSILSNIDRHVARTQADDLPRVYDHKRSFARAKSGGPTDAGAMCGASTAATSFSKTSTDVDVGVNVSEMEDIAGEIDEYDDGRALICNSTPSAVVEVFTHQGDHEAFAAEEMLQSVCGQLPASTPSISTSSVSPFPTPSPDAGAGAALSSRTANQGEILRLTYHVDIWDSSHFRDSLATCRCAGTWRRSNRRSRARAVRVRLDGSGAGAPGTALSEPLLLRTRLRAFLLTARW